MHQLRLYITVILLLSVSIVASAQKLTLSPEAINDNLSYMKVIGQDENGFYLLQSNISLELQKDHVGLRSRKYKLSYFGNDLHQHWTKSITTHIDDANIEGVTFFNERAVVVTSIWSKAESKLAFYYDEYNADGSLYITGKKSGECLFDKNSSIEKPQLILSSSKNKIGIYCNEMRDKDQVMHLIVADTSLTVTTSAKATLSYSEKDLSFSNAVLSDSDQFCLLAQLRLRDPEKDRRRLWLYRLFYLGNGSDNFKEFVVNEPERQMTEASLVIDKKNNTAIVTGFYADRGSFAGTGILFASIPLLNPLTLTKNNFTINGDAQTKLIGERNTGNSMGLFNYPIQKIILRNDGGAVIVAEAEYLSEYSYFDYYTQSYNRRVEFHFDNIVVMSVNVSGAIDWTQVIRKDQTSVDDDGIYSSFAYGINSDEIAILINGDIGRNNEIISYRIDNKGQISNTKITRQGENISLIPRSGRQVDESTIIVPGINKKRVYLLKIEF